MAQGFAGGALRDYGVVVTGSIDDNLSYDGAATRSKRAELRAAPDRAFFDRGPGYAELSGGADAADVDWL